MPYKKFELYCTLFPFSNSIYLKLPRLTDIAEASTGQTNKCKCIAERQAGCVMEEKPNKFPTDCGSLRSTPQILGQPMILCPLVDIQPIVTCILQGLQMKADSAAQTFDNMDNDSQVE